ncbi:MAG TPA: AGE family epimerase/isomerase [Candidatus Hydrogenedentes bacterium]|nr:AGE family epimerase/isomerase [Candidatus Hydrogenedentota bacterium]
MSIRQRLNDARMEIENHLQNELLPFWLTHGVDKEHGGFLTYFDRDGNPTGETDKTLVCQTRCIYTYASAHRAGFGDGKFLEMARQGVEFLIKHFWDEENAGWHWICRRDGTPLSTLKIMYGHSFAIYALSEYAMASGDHRGIEMAEETYETITRLAADNEHGGFFEFMERDWTPRSGGRSGGDRKSLDVHMHLMEAFTNLYEATGVIGYKEDTEYVINLIFEHMVHPKHGTGIAQFTLDWQPVRAIIFDNVWGSDRDAAEDEGRPLDNTSYGHNVEFGWLLKHAIDICGLDLEAFKPRIRKLYDHCVQYGIDWEGGGVFCEGPHDGPARERNKEFWQQAETLIAMLDGFEIFGDEKFLDAYENMHGFVMDYVINHEVGEWFPLFDEDNNLLWDYMGHAWKINYHTVRSMIECDRRLNRLLAIHK